MDQCCAECSPEKKESSQAVSIVFDMIRDVMWKIRDIDGIEKQQSMALQFFKFLWSKTSLDAIAAELVKYAMSADKKWSEEEIKEEIKEEDSMWLESLYINKD